MAVRTPSPMTPGNAHSSDQTDETPETRTQRLIDTAAERPSGTTASRAVRPPTTARHKRLPGQYGEAELVWRCLDCGIVGSLDALPTRCVCGAHREALCYVVED